MKKTKSRPDAQQFCNSVIRSLVRLGAKKRRAITGVQSGSTSLNDCLEQSCYTEQGHDISIRIHPPKLCRCDFVTMGNAFPPAITCRIFFKGQNDDAGRWVWGKLRHIIPLDYEFATEKDLASVNPEQLVNDLWRAITTYDQWRAKITPVCEAAMQEIERAVNELA